jgi:F-type H+-transporting ATPase subunit delta
MKSFARPYARAALAVAGSTESGVALRDELAAFAAALRESRELTAAFANPAVPLDVKGRVLDQVAELMGIGPLTRRLLHALATRHRLGRLEEVVAALTDRLNQRLGIAVAEVTTAEQLGEEERRELQRVLEEKTGKRLEMRLAVEPALLAGFVARVGSQRFDGSLRGQLERLGRELAGT